MQLVGSAPPPRVSVVMAIDRMDGYLKQAIDSVLQQSFGQFEFLIVIDEKLRERYQEILGLASGDPRVELLESPSLGGLGLALNLGIARARGEYIARMDGDDLSLPERLQQQVQYLDTHLSVMVLGCRVQMIDAAGERLSKPYPFVESDRKIRKHLPFRSPLPHPALMMRRTALYSIGGYKYGRVAEDWEMFLRLARVPGLEFHNLDSLLFLHRRHGNQGTSFDRIHRHFIDISGVLFAEFLTTYSPKYLVGIFLRHPWISRTRRKLLARLRRQRDLATT